MRISQRGLLNRHGTAPFSRMGEVMRGFCFAVSMPEGFKMVASRYGQVLFFGSSFFLSLTCSWGGVGRKVIFFGR